MATSYNCDECGKWCPDVSKMVVESGLKLAPKKFCSAGCKRKYEGGNGGGSSAGAAAAGGVAGGLVGGIVGSILSTNENDAQVEIEENKLIDQEYSSFIGKIESMKFDGSANEISNNINELLSMSQGTIPISLQEQGGFNSISRKKTIKQIMEKVEYGIMKLQSVNPAEADYFRKKIDGKKKSKRIKTIIIASILGVIFLPIIIFIIWMFL